MIKAKNLISGKCYCSRFDQFLFRYSAVSGTTFPRTILKENECFLCLENSIWKNNNGNSIHEFKIMTKCYIGYISCYSDEAWFIEL